MSDLRIDKEHPHTQASARRRLLAQVVRRAQFDAIMYSMLPSGQRARKQLQQEAIRWLRGETDAPEGKLHIRDCIAPFDSGSIEGALAQARWHFEDKNRSGEIPEGLFSDGLYVGDEEDANE